MKKEILLIFFILLLGSMFLVSGCSKTRGTQGMTCELDSSTLSLKCHGTGEAICIDYYSDNQDTMFNSDYYAAMLITQRFETDDKGFIKSYWNHNCLFDFCSSGGIALPSGGSYSIYKNSYRCNNIVGVAYEPIIDPVTGLPKYNKTLEMDVTPSKLRVPPPPLEEFVECDLEPYCYSSSDLKVDAIVYDYGSVIKEALLTIESMGYSVTDPNSYEYYISVGAPADYAGIMGEVVNCTYLDNLVKGFRGVCKEGSGGAYCDTRSVIA